MKLKTLLMGVLAGAKKHEGTILTAVSVGSTLAAVYFALKDGPRLMEKLDNLRAEDATNFEKAKGVTPILARTAVATGVSIACQIINHNAAANAISSLASALTLKNAVIDDKNAVIAEHERVTREVAGDEAEDKIKTEVQKKFVGQTVGEGPTIRYIYTGHGNELFHDPLTGAWFYSDRNIVKDTARDLSYAAMYADVGVDEWAYSLGIPHTDGNEEECWKEGAVIAIDLEPKKLENDQLYYEIKFTRSVPSKRRRSDYDD